jgi:antitoxin component YwqK of YwqJK toxin-antitoxin module
MKTIAITTFIIIVALCNAQKVSYQPIFIDQCSKEILPSYTYSFMQNYGKENGHKIFPFPTKYELPDTGLYCLRYGIEDSIDVLINSYGTIIDSIYLQNVRLVSYVSNPPISEYFQCDTILCNGLVIDYYKNDLIRIIGTFSNGQPIDTLKEFYRNGQLKNLFYPFKKTYKFGGRKYHKKLIIGFDYYGNCEYYYNSKKGIERHYYPNKTLASEYHFKNKKLNYIEYFENKNIKIELNKKLKKEYYSNGNIHIITSRKELLKDKLSTFFTNFYNHYIPFSPPIHTVPHYFTYNLQEFDTNGKLINSLKFVSEEYEYLFSYGFPKKIKDIPINDITNK